MPDQTDPLWDGQGSDPELDRLQSLLSPLKTQAPLPELPARPMRPPAWLLPVAAALLLLAAGGFVIQLLPAGDGSTSHGVAQTLPEATGAAVTAAPGTSTAPDRSGAPSVTRIPDSSGRTSSFTPSRPRATGDSRRTAGGTATSAGAMDAAWKLTQAQDPGEGQHTLIVYEDTLALSANPVHERSMADVRLNELLHLALYAPNYADQPMPVLARSAELDGSGRILTITLGEHRWTDGKPVTAHDVVFTLAAHEAPSSRSLDRHRWGFITDAEALDAHTLVLTLDRTYPEPPLERLYLKILPQHLFEDEPMRYSTTYRTKPVTAGHYRVHEKDHKNWILTSSPFSPRPTKIREVRLQQVSEKRTQAELMIYEYGHAMIDVLPQQRAELDADDCCRLMPYPSRAWWYTAFNETNEHLALQEVRQALSLAVDRQEALDLIGEGELISGPHPMSSRYYNHAVPVPHKDLVRAAELMRGAGYVQVGTHWTRNGESIDLRFFYAAALGEQGALAATNIVGQLKTFGINVSDPAGIRSASWGTRIEQNRNFDMLLGSWTFDMSEDVGQLFHSNGVRNVVAFGDDRVDALLAGARDSTDPSEQRAYMLELHARLAETQPYLFLWSLRSFSAVSVDLVGAHVQPHYYFSQLPDWSIKKR